MPNSLRTPRKGKTANSRRIAEAVDNEEWQRFRVSMKGKSTAEKLDMLEEYYEQQRVLGYRAEYPNDRREFLDDRHYEDVKIRIDNYIKALCRGGQLEAGMTFDHFNDGCIRNHIKR